MFFISEKLTQYSSVVVPDDENSGNGIKDRIERDEHTNVVGEGLRGNVEGRADEQDEHWEGVPEKRDRELEEESDEQLTFLPLETERLLNG